MAKTDAAAESATPEKKEGAAGKRKKTFKKRGEKRVIHHGLAHIHASFNNTTVTITDTEGNVATRKNAPSRSAISRRGSMGRPARRRSRATAYSCAKSRR